MAGFLVLVVILALFSGGRGYYRRPLFGGWFFRPRGGLFGPIGPRPPMGGGMHMGGPGMGGFGGPGGGFGGPHGR